MKHFDCGDTVWCWERTDDDFLVDGFKAQCTESMNRASDFLQVMTEAGAIKDVYIRDVEPYNEFMNYHEHELVMNAFKKFKSLPHEKKKEMLQKIGLLELKEHNPEPVPDPYSMPEEKWDEWDASGCKNFEECWCGGCADAVA